MIDTFRTMDSNRDGKVSLAEFRQILPLLTSGSSGAEAEEAFTDADADALFETIDHDRSGHIDYRELHANLRQGNSVTLAKRLQDGAAGEIAVEAKNKNALRGSGGRESGGEGSGEGGAAGRDGSRAQTPKQRPMPNLAMTGNRPPVHRPPFANHSPREVMVAPPVVGAARARSAKHVYSMHGEQTWFAIPAKNDFVLQPLRHGEVPPKEQQRQSKVWQSVQAVRRSTGAVSAEMRHVSALSRSITFKGTETPSWRQSASMAALQRDSSGASLALGGRAGARRKGPHWSEGGGRPRSRGTMSTSASAPLLAPPSNARGNVIRSRRTQSEEVAPAPWAPTLAADSPLRTPHPLLPRCSS